MAVTKAPAEELPSDAETLIDVFTTGTDPAWALLAFGLMVAATVLRIFSQRDYPAWTWRLYLGIAFLIFATRGADVYIAHETVLIAFEIGLLSATALAGAVLFYLIVTNPDPPTLKEVIRWFWHRIRNRKRR